MATYPGLEAELKVGGNDADAIQDSERLAAGAYVRKTERQQFVATHAAEGLPFRPMPEIVPIAVIPETLVVPRARRKLRRVMTREQGRALEILGHAADYLADQYIYEGEDSEILRIESVSAGAVQVLISARLRILDSLPLVETKMQRLWNSLFHRKQRQKTVRKPGPIAVVRLS